MRHQRKGTTAKAETEAEVDIGPEARDLARGEQYVEGEGQVPEMQPTPTVWWCPPPLSRKERLLAKKCSDFLPTDLPFKGADNHMLQVLESDLSGKKSLPIRLDALVFQLEVQNWGAVYEHKLQRSCRKFLDHVGGSEKYSTPLDTDDMAKWVADYLQLWFPGETVSVWVAYVGKGGKLVLCFTKSWGKPWEVPSVVPLARS